MLKKVKKVCAAILLSSSLCIISPQASAFSIHVHLSLSSITDILSYVRGIYQLVRPIEQGIPVIGSAITTLTDDLMGALKFINGLLQQGLDATDMNKIYQDISITGDINKNAHELGITQSNTLLKNTVTTNPIANKLNTWSNTPIGEDIENSPINQATLTGTNFLQKNSGPAKNAGTYIANVTGVSEALPHLTPIGQATVESIKYHSHYVTQAAARSHAITHLGSVLGNTLSQTTPNQAGKATSGYLHQAVREAGNLFVDKFWSSGIAKLFGIGTIKVMFTTVVNMGLTVAEIATSAKTIALGVDIIVSEFVLAMDAIRGTQLLLNAIKSQSGGSALKKPASQAASATGAGTAQQYVYDNSVAHYIIQNGNEKYFYEGGNKYVWNPGKKAFTYTDQKGQEYSWDSKTHSGVKISS